MSRWFPDRITLHLAATDSLAAVGGGEPLRQRTHELALASLERRLDELQPARHTRVACVFAGDLVRYCLVPWNPSATGARRRHSFAAHCFKEVYGDAAAGWRVSLDKPRYGEPALACAIDASLLDRVAALSAKRGLVPQSMQPSLMHATRAASRAVQLATVWCVVQEPRTTTLLLVARRRPMLVKVLAAREHDLGVVLAREWLALGFEAARCPVVLVSPDLSSLHELNGWHVRVLGGANDPDLHRQPSIELFARGLLSA